MKQQMHPLPGPQFAKWTFSQARQPEEEDLQIYVEIAEVSPPEWCSSGWTFGSDVEKALEKDQNQRCALFTKKLKKKCIQNQEPTSKTLTSPVNLQNLTGFPVIPFLSCQTPRKG